MNAQLESILSTNCDELKQRLLTDAAQRRRTIDDEWHDSLLAAPETDLPVARTYRAPVWSAIHD